MWRMGFAEGNPTNECETVTLSVSAYLTRSIVSAPWRWESRSLEEGSESVSVDFHWLTKDLVFPEASEDQQAHGRMEAASCSSA